MRLVEHQRIAEVAEAEWDALATHGPMFLAHGFLAHLERGESRGGDPTYFVVRDERERLVGALPCHALTAPPSWLYDPSRVFAGCEQLESADWFPAIVAGGVSDFRSDVLLARDLDGASRQLALGMLLAAARALAHDRDASLVLLYLPAPLAAEVHAALDAPSHLVFEDAEQTLVVREPTFDGYVQRLPKGRRETVRRERRAYLASDSATRVVALEDAPLHVLGTLHANLMRKYGHEHTDAQSRASLEADRRDLGDRGLVFLSVRGSDVTGFSLCFAHGRSLYVRSTGYDYGAPTPFAYANLMFYEPLTHAMGSGLDDVQLGLSTNQAKLLRGADLDPLYAVLAPREAPSWADQEATASCSDRRLDTFWEAYGRYAIHQTRNDLGTLVSAS